MNVHNLFFKKAFVSALASKQWADTHHYEVPHASGFGHQRGDAAAAGHQNDLDGLGVQKVVQQLGGFSWVTLQGQNDRALPRRMGAMMDVWINNKDEKWIKVIEKRGERTKGEGPETEGAGERKMRKIRARQTDGMRTEGEGTEGNK